MGYATEVFMKLHQVNESVYDKLDDTDEFRNEEEDEEYEFCANCGAQFYIFAGESSDDLIWCNGCGATICQRCLPGGDLFSEKDREAYEFYPETVELEHCPFC